MYVDCDGTVPFKCAPGDDVCVARRNGHEKSVHENVTHAQVEAYVAGKNATQLEAYTLVRQAGGRVTSLDGVEYGLDTRPLLCSNGLTHEGLLGVIQGAAVRGLDP